MGKELRYNIRERDRLRNTTSIELEKDIGKKRNKTRIRE
jgi:hypothetical protein